MKNKFFALFLLAAIIVLGGSSSAFAQAAPFPAGCGSAIGYSATTGQPCSGTGTAITSNLPGCTTPLGYSATSGQACSGNGIAIQFLAGCTSIYGYSAVSGQPCNGTTVAAFAPGGTSIGGTVIGGTPGLPRTGAGGNATRNAMLLLATAALATLGLTYVFGVSKKA